MEERYERNITNIFSESDQNKILSKKIAVIGCGGQGSYIIDFLSRLGVYSITLWDGDKYTKSNINRQLGCSENNIGKYKSEVLSQYIKTINPTIEVKYFTHFFQSEEDLEELEKNDLVFLTFDDSVNSIEIRSKIRDLIKQGKIIGINCPAFELGGFIVIYTKFNLELYDKNLDELKRQRELGLNTHGGGTAYSCAIMAAEAVNCMVQLFTNKGFPPIGYKLDIDTFTHNYMKS